MKIFPAIDIRDGKCVRLIQGDYNKETQYGDPVKMAERWKEEGAKYLHIVDLDAAKGDASNNFDLIKAIVQNVDVSVQVGGGIRSLERIEELLNVGVAYVILGTAALKDPEFVKEAVQKYGDYVVVSIDARDGYVATDGWLETSNIKATDFVQTLEEIGVTRIVYTDISKDGMLKGPNFKELKEINETTTVDVIASGGVSSVEDVRELKEMKLCGAIIGKALYEGKIKMVSLLGEI